jgi:hypothetical protein
MLGCLIATNCTRFFKYGFVSVSKEWGAKNPGFRFVSNFKAASEKYLSTALKQVYII